MANRFWVGGTGIWNSVNILNWSATSGGLGGATAPTSADNAFFDANSGTGTCTTESGATNNAVTFNTSNVTLTFGANHNCSAGFTLTLGSINLNNQTLTCTGVSSSNANVRSINFGTSGKIILTGNNATVLNFNNATNFSYSGTSYIESNYSGSTGTRVFANGATGGSASTALNLYITNGTDIVTVGNSFWANNLDFTGFSGTLNNSSRFIISNLTISNGMTLTGGVGATNFLGTGAQAITSNGKTLDFPLTFDGIGGTFAFQDALTQGSTRAFTVTNGTVQLKNGVTSTVGSFVTSGTNQKFLQSTLANSQSTLSQASGTASTSYLTIQDVNATGGAIFNSFTGAGNSASAQNVNAGNNVKWNFIPAGSGMMGFF